MTNQPEMDLSGCNPMDTILLKNLSGYLIPMFRKKTHLQFLMPIKKFKSSKLIEKIVGLTKVKKNYLA